MDLISQIWLLSATGNGFNPLSFAWAWLKEGIKWAVERSFDITMAIGLPSYALGIFLFTIVIKILLQPAMTKQLRTSRQMSKLQPKMQEIQKKYAGNQQRIQQETMKLYQEANVSPLSGCLPLLIQMPIMIALFQALRDFVPTYPEYYTFFWIGVPELGVVLKKGIEVEAWVNGLGAASDIFPGIWGWILPIIVGASMFLQQYLGIVNKKDQTQKMMLYFMPVMFGWLTRGFPAFLALYWTYQSFVGGAIQLFLNKQWAKEDAREEEERRIREEEERKQKKMKKAEQKGKVFVEEDDDDNNNENIITVGGVDYILPHGYTVRHKKVKAHPYSDEEETITVAVMPDGREKPITSLKKSMILPPNSPGFGFGKKK